MIKTFQNNYPFVFYLLKFIGVFCVCYFGTLALIGICAAGGFYSPFIAKYFDYVSLLRKSLLHGSKWLLNLFGYKAEVSGIYYLKLITGKKVHVGYDCLGYGVMSFWNAFIVANKGSLSKKLRWIFGGLFLIWLINIVRISMLLVAINNKQVPPFFDHHTWFNIVAYLLIFLLIYFYDRSVKAKRQEYFKRSVPLK